MIGPTEPDDDEPTYLSFAALNLHRDGDQTATNAALFTVTGFLGAIAATVQDDGGIALVLPAASEEDHLVGYLVTPDGNIAQSAFPVHYTSTACIHGAHDRCGQTCKWCDEACRCPCHGGPYITPPPPDIAEQMARAGEPETTPHEP